MREVLFQVSYELKRSKKGILWWFGVIVACMWIRLCVAVAENRVLILQAVSEGKRLAMNDWTPIGSITGGAIGFMILAIMFCTDIGKRDYQNSNFNQTLRTLPISWRKILTAKVIAGITIMWGTYGMMLLSLCSLYFFYLQNVPVECQVTNSLYFYLLEHFWGRCMFPVEIWMLPLRFLFWAAIAAVFVLGADYITAERRNGR